MMMQGRQSADSVGRNNEENTREITERCLVVCVISNQQFLGSHRPQSLSLVCYSLHHEITGLWLAASATAQVLAWAGCFSYTDAPYEYGSLCANMTSSIKQEVHNILQRRLRSTEPRT